MAVCYRCGEETGSVIPECPKCLEGNPTPKTPPRSSKPVEFKGILVEIDWDRVKTLEDVLIVLSGANLKVVKGSSSYWKLRKFLKD